MDGGGRNHKSEGNKDGENKDEGNKDEGNKDEGNNLGLGWDKGYFFLGGGRV